MFAFVRKLTASPIIPLGWTILTIILLCLPGSAFPGGGFFDIDIPHLDKVVHVILFGGITLLWSLYFQQRNGNWRVMIIAVALSAIALGVCMEFIQFNFIPYRAFDTGDILANTVSILVVAGFFYFRSRA